MLSSSSGLGHHPLTVEIAGSSPAGSELHLLFHYSYMDTRPQGNRDNRVQLVYLNESIKAPNIIILDEAGENLGTFPRRKALEIAQEK